MISLARFQLEAHGLGSWTSSRNEARAEAARRGRGRAGDGRGEVRARGRGRNARRQSKDADADADAASHVPGRGRETEGVCGGRDAGAVGVASPRARRGRGRTTRHAAEGGHGVCRAEAPREGESGARGVANDGGRTDSRRRDDDDIDTRQHFDVRAPAASDAPGGDLSNQLSIRRPLAADVPSGLGRARVLAPPHARARRLDSRRSMSVLAPRRPRRRRASASARRPRARSPP